MPSDRRVPTIDERIANARRHVELGRALIEHHKELFERHRLEGRDTKAAADLLEAFERTQKAFEWDLAELERRRDQDLASVKRR